MSDTLPLAVIAGLASGIAFVALFVIWSSHAIAFTRFIGPIDALNAVHQRYPSARSEELEPYFGYLKYEGEDIGFDGNPEKIFTWNKADRSSGEVLDVVRTHISLEQGEEDIFDKNYYVWTVADPSAKITSYIIFIDAETDKILGVGKVSLIGLPL